MFKELVKSILAYEKNSSVLSLKLIDTLKKDIREDIIAAFDLSEPLIDRHQDLYRSSTSYLDFLFKYCEIPTRSDSGNNTQNRKLEDIRIQKEEFQREIIELKKQNNKLTTKIAELEQMISVKENLLTEAIVEKEKVLQEGLLLKQRAEEEYNKVLNYQMQHPPMTGLFPSKIPIDEESKVENISSHPAIEYKVSPNDDEHLSKKLEETRNALSELEKKHERRKVEYNNISKNFNEFKNDINNQLDKLYTDILHVIKRKFPRIQIPLKNSTDNEKDRIEEISTLNKKTYESLENIINQKEENLKDEQNKLQRFENSLKGVLNETHLSRDDIELKFREISKENDRLNQSISELKNDLKSMQRKQQSTNKEFESQRRFNQEPETNLFTPYNSYPPTLTYDSPLQLKWKESPNLKIEEIQVEEDSNNKIRQLEKNNLSLQEDYKNLQKKFNSFKEELKSITNLQTSDVVDINEEIRNVFREHRTMSSELTALKNTVGEPSLNIVDFEKDIQKLKNNCEEQIQAMKNEHKENSNNLQAKIQELEEKEKNLDQKLTANFNIRNEEVESKNLEIKALRENIKKSNEEINRLETVLQNTLKETNQLKKYIEEEEKRAKVEYENNKEIYIATLEKFKTESEEKIQQHQQIIEQKNNDIEYLKAELLEKSGFVTEEKNKQEQIKSLTQEQERLKEEKDKITQMYEEQNREKDLTIETLNNQVEELNKSVKLYEYQFNSLQNALEQEFQTYQHKEQQKNVDIINFVKTEIERKTQEIEQLKNENQKLSDQYNNLMQEKSQKEIELFETLERTKDNDGTEQYENAKVLMDTFDKQFQTLMNTMKETLSILRENKNETIQQNLKKLLEVYSKYIKELFSIQNQFKKSLKAKCDVDKHNLQLQQKLDQTEFEYNRLKLDYDNIIKEFNQHKTSVLGKSLVKKFPNRRPINTSPKNIPEKKLTTTQKILKKYRNKKIRSHQPTLDTDKIKHKKQSNVKQFLKITENMDESVKEDVDAANEFTKYKKRKVDPLSQDEETTNWREEYEQLKEEMNKINNRTLYGKDMNLQVMQNLFYQLYEAYFKQKFSLTQNKQNIEFRDIFNQLKKLNEDIEKLEDTDSNKIIRILGLYVQNDLKIVSGETITEILYIKDEYLEQCMQNTIDHLKCQREDEDNFEDEDL